MDMWHDKGREKLYRMVQTMKRQDYQMKISFVESGGTHRPTI